MVNDPNKNITLTIDTVDVSTYVIEAEINEVRNGITTARLILDPDIANFITIRNGLYVGIKFNYIDEPTIFHEKFYGIINNLRTSVQEITLNCVDPLWKCTGETITKVYEATDVFAGEPELILTDMYNYAGLVSDGTTIDPTPVVLPEITCDSSYIFEKTKTIIDALTWDQWYNFTDDKVYVTNPDLYVVNSEDLTVGDNVIDLPEYNDNIFQTINEIELQGVSSDSAYEETFTGDGTTTKFTLGRTPVSTYVYVTVGGVEQIGTVDGALSTYDYLINKQQGYIEFAAGSIPPASADNIVVNYTATELTSVTVDDDTSQTNNTKRKLVISVKDAITVDDAVTRANGLIKNSKNSYYTFPCNVVGVLTRSTHEKANYNDQAGNVYLTDLYINKITWRWPGYFEEFTLGSKPFNVDDMFYNTEERVRRLERKRQEGQLLTINKLSSSDIKLTVNDITIQQVVLGSQTNHDVACDGASQVGSDLFWADVANIYGAGSTSIGTGTSNELLCYISPATIATYSATLDDAKIDSIAVKITGITTGAGTATMDSIQIMKNYFGVGNILAPTTSFTTSSSTITVGSGTNVWGLNYDYNDIVRDGFGVKMVFANTATTLAIDSVSLVIYYKPISSSTDIVKGATTLTQTDYDNGTETTETEVIYTTTVDNELEINTTI